MTEPESFVRVFMAIEIPSAIRQAMSRLQDKLATSDARVKWVRQEHMHLTLVFLGDVLENRISVVKGTMDEAVHGVPPFEYTVKRVGTFGRPRAPKVLWAGVQGPSQLNDLHRNLTGHLNEETFEIDPKPFRPHLTLGRVRSRENVDALTRLLGSAKNTDFGAGRVERVQLIQSVLGSTGSSYSVIHEALLQGA